MATNKAAVWIFLLVSGWVSAADLILKPNHRIPITGDVTVTPSGDILVDPIANAGVAGDGWCPGSSPPPPPPPPNPTPPPHQCGAPPDGWVRQTSVGTTHRGVYGPFPSTAARGIFNILNSRYVSLEFTTPADSVRRIGTFQWVLSIAGSAPLAVTISPCPGDFDSTSLGTRCRAFGGETAIGWVIGGPQSGYCQLQSNTRYYLNYAFRNPADGSSSCASASCGVNSVTSSATW